ncbi:MAG: hypothetical protein C4K60_12330 [Ideonella sp. MAG2]|nr:MAG: hypothetical protein C4K60_12330 [Ideonella sp. MAG2]
MPTCFPRAPLARCAKRHPPLLPLALAMAATSPAWAQESGLSVGVSQQVLHDSNVLRSPEGSEQGAWVSYSGMRLSLDTPVGRGSFKANASAEAVRYRHLSQLNHTGLKLDATLAVDAAERISGEVGASTEQSLFRYDQLGLVQTERSLRRSKRAFVAARVGVVTRWTAEASVSLQDTQFTDVPLTVRDQRWLTAEAGLRYQPSPDFYVRGAVRGVDGAYTREGLADDDFRREELQGVVGWQASGASNLQASAVLSRETHTLASVRDSNKWLGSVAWRWQPTGKLQFNTRLARDSYAGSTETDISSADTVLRTSASVGATWRLSAKVQLDAQGMRAQRTLDNVFSSTVRQTRQGRDTTDTLGLTLSYQPLRSVGLSCSANWTRRTVDGDLTGLSYPFAATDYGCAGQFWLR